jgi:carboxyl-terminal processing protease
MLRKTKRAFIVYTIAIIGVISLSAGDSYFEVSKNLEIFSDIYKELNMYYVDDIKHNELMRTSIDAMLSSLDPYTNFISEAEMENYRFQTTGKYGGIGAIIRKKDDHIAIIEPYEASPARKAGLLAGDLIIEINNESTKGKTVDQVSKLLKGAPGTTVDLLIRRNGFKQDRLYQVTREEIKVDNVPFHGMINDTTGYIKLNQFTQNAGKNVANALKDLKKNNALNGLVLDLRGNPGGLLNEAVNVCNAFIPKNKHVVSTKGKVAEWNRDFKTLNQPVDTEIPLTILISKGSASASEIVAGTLQDYDRAVVVGQPSFGKGLVQNTRELSYNTLLKLTTAKYYIPSGRSIQSITYTHDENNSQINKPDSTRKAFQTRNGRTVYDGQGIAPDIQVVEPAPSLLETALFQNSHFFFFANQYVANHDTFQAETVTDEMFADFQEYLGKKNFSYETQTEQHLDEIEEHFASIDIDNGVSQSLAQIEQALEKEKQNNMQEQKDELKEILYLELVSRYRGQAGKHEASVLVDPFVKKGIEVIKNANRYRQILAINQ